MKKRWIVLFATCFLFIGLLFGCKKHEHTFSEAWLNNNEAHWHEATCEHLNEVKDYGLHDYSDWTILVEPTEQEEGLKERSCRVCSYKEEEKIDKVIHQHHYQVDKIIVPTCEAVGYTHYTCSCGDSYDGDYKKALGHSYSAWEIIQEPTFKQQGLIRRICQSDDTHIDIKTLPVLNEKDYAFKSLEIPSCEGAGIDQYSYHLETETLHFKVIIDPLGHDFSLTWTIDQDPTCENPGYQSHHCSRCDAKADVEEIEPLGHQYGPFRVLESPTHTHLGLLGRVCEHDENHIISIILPILNQTDYQYQSIRKPDCEMTGLDLYQYTYLNVVYAIYDELAALGHQYGKWELVKEPTIDQVGMLKKCCSRDETHIEEFVLPALNRIDYVVLPTVDATCTMDGYGTYQFTIDQQSFYFEETIVALGHDFDDWILGTSPTLETGGFIKRSCKRDGNHIEEHQLAPLNEEDYEYILLSEGNCITPQEERYRYTIDGISFDFDIERQATGHQYGAWTLVLAPSLLEFGTLKRICSLDTTHQELHTLPKLNRIDYTYKQLLPSTCTELGQSSYTYEIDAMTFHFYVDLAALGHNYASEFTIDIEASCEDEGLKSQHCSRCESTINSTIIEPLGHEFGSFDIETSPTFEKEGAIKSICSRDSKHQQTLVLPKLNEVDYKLNHILMATCLNAGLDCYRYTYNLETVDFEVVLEPLGHRYEKWQLKKAPTLEETGELINYCSHDPEHQISQLLSALNDTDYDYFILEEPSCLLEGTAQYTYLIENQTFDFEVSLSALGHRYNDNGVCIHCEKYQIFTTIPLDDETCLLASYDGDTSVTSIVIPIRLEGRRVVELNTGLLKELQQLSSLTLPILDQTLQSLFSNAIPQSLTTLHLSSGKKIPQEAFMGTKIKTISLPDTIEQIEERAFLNCTELTEIHLPSALEQIGREAFKGCVSLAIASSNKALSIIEDEAFAACPLLEQMTLPESISSLGDSIWDIQTLKQLYYDGTIESWCNLSFTSPYQNPMAIVEQFYWLEQEGYVELICLEVPKSISFIGKYQFIGLASLESIILPEGVVRIEKNAFENCIHLADITMPNSIEVIEQNAFKNCDAIQYYEENSCRYIGNEDNHRLVLIEQLDKTCLSFELDGKTKIIYDYAFSDCIKLKTIEFGEAVTSIGMRAFNQCRALDFIDLSTAVIYIGDQVFVNMKNEFTIYCHSLSKPPMWEDSWNNNGYRVLWGIKQNEIVEVAGLSYLLNKTVATVVGINFTQASIAIPEEVTVNENSYMVTGIGAGVFMNDTIVEEISLPSHITLIEADAFKGCINLRQIRLPESLKELGASAFSGCQSLEEIIIPSQVSIISKSLFSGCITLRRVEISSLSIIEDFAFYNCSALDQLILPASVTYIAEHAFHNCTNLKIFSLAQNKPDSFPTNWYGSASGVYWYREIKPAEGGSYWHYVSSSNEPVIW